jgi:hypothetical protein
MRQFLVVALLLVVGTLSDAAHARKARFVADTGDNYVNKTLPDHATVWHCWYDGAAAILCRLGETIENAATTATGAGPAVDARLPAIVKSIWRKPGEMLGALITIPMHTAPVDMTLPGQLADSVMCGGATQPCGVIFARDALSLARLVMDRALQASSRALAWSTYSY